MCFPIVPVTQSSIVQSGNISFDSDVFKDRNGTNQPHSFLKVSAQWQVKL